MMMPATKAKYRQALLRALLAGDGYGLALVARCADRGVRLMQGRVYPILRQMEAEGLLESYVSDGQLNVRDARPRRYYRITEAGKTALDVR